MTNYLTTVRRSLRLACANDYGSYQIKTLVRAKMLNPLTCRMVYVDGVVGQKFLKNKQTKKELNYFELMKQRLMNEEKKEVIIPDRRSKRIQARQRVFDGLNTTLKLNNLTRTIEMWDKTIVV